jgi:hypothetical protein
VTDQEERATARPGAEPGHPVVETPTEARQADHSRLNFRVLLISVVVAFVALTIIYFVFFPGGFPPT